MFLSFQILLFIILIGFQVYRISKEITIMKKMKTELDQIHKNSDTESYEIDRKINDIFNSINKSQYKKLWERYYNRVSEKKEDERINVEPFFGFDIMHYHMGYRPLMDVGAGICVSLGVLGTFIGLSMGLADLQIDNTEALRTGIGGLLSGMKVAFYTSVLGVVLSLFWTAIDRIVSSKLDNNIDWHSEKMDYLLSTDDEELFLNRLEKITRSQADHLKTLLTDALEKAMQPVVMSIKESNGTVSNAFSELNNQFEKLQSGVDNQSKLLENQLELTKNNSHDISDRLVEQITGGTQESISEFSNLLKSSQVLQTHMVETVNKVVENFATTQSSQTTTLERTEKLFETFEKVTGEMEQMRSSYTEASGFMNDLSSSFQKLQELTNDQLPVQQDVMKSNQALAEKYDGLTERFKEFNQNIERKYEDLLDEVLSVSKGLTSTFQQMTSKFSESMNIQSNLLKESDLLLSNVKGVVEHLTPIAPELKDVVRNILLLKNQLESMQQLQSSLLPELVEMKKQTNEVVEETLVTTRSYMSDMRDQLEVMKVNWTSTREQFENTTETLQLSVKDFSENIDSGLSKTYQHFDETLTNAVKQVSNLVYQFSDTQKDFIDTLEDLTDEISRMKAVNTK